MVSGTNLTVIMHISLTVEIFPIQITAFGKFIVSCQVFLNEKGREKIGEEKRLSHGLKVYLKT